MPFSTPMLVAEVTDDRTDRVTCRNTFLHVDQPNKEVRRRSMTSAPRLKSESDTDEALGDIVRRASTLRRPAPPPPPPVVPVVPEVLWTVNGNEATFPRWWCLGTVRHPDCAPCVNHWGSNACGFGRICTFCHHESHSHTPGRAAFTESTFNKSPVTISRNEFEELISRNTRDDLQLKEALYSLERTIFSRSLPKRNQNKRDRPVYRTNERGRGGRGRSRWVDKDRNEKF